MKMLLKHIKLPSNGQKSTKTPQKNQKFKKSKIKIKILNLVMSEPNFVPRKRCFKNRKKKGQIF